MTGGHEEATGGDRYLSRAQDHIESIARILGDLQGMDTVAHELIQNADDAPGATRMRFTVTADALEVWNDGTFEKCGDVRTAECEWRQQRGHRCDFHSFRKIGSGDKRGRSGTTGAFGIGFTAVYQLTDQPELIANGEHWVVDETADENKRIRTRAPGAPFEGTIFRLPWARDSSAFRQLIRQRPVADTVVADFPARLREAIPQAMPFLKKLDSIEVVSAEGATCFHRDPTPAGVTVRSSDGPERRWAVLEGHFDQQADALKASNATVIEQDRSSAVRIAIPVDGDKAPGVLYATLPTKESVHMPLLVNADFYPASDRKRIKFDDNAPETEWNRIAIAAAAGLLASSLEQLPELIGDKLTAELLLAARKLQKIAEGPEADHSFGEFWSAIAELLPDTPVVPTVAGAYGTPRKVRLWAEKAELDAAAQLRSLGIDLVAEPVREAWFLLRGGEVGIENLHLRHLVAALEARGLTMKRWDIERPPAAVDWAPEIDKLWRVLDVLLGINDRRDEGSRTGLKRCAIAPGWDGEIWTLGAVHRLDQDVQDLLDDVGVSATFLDADRVGDDLPHLVAQMPQATPAQVVGWVDAAFAQGSTADDETRAALLRWAFDHQRELDAYDLAVLARLPIFPAPGGRRPLTQLALPGDFRDPLALASILDLTDVEDLRPFFEKLGARPLTLATYCTDFLAPAIENDEFSDVKREKATRMIAKHLSGIRGEPSVATALRALPLVPCTDGVWRQGSEVYLRNDLGLLVGDNVPIAAPPRLDREEHLELSRWLGATPNPRVHDVRAQCDRLSRGPANHRESAAAIIDYAAKRFTDDRNTAEVDFAPLRQISWVPIEGDRSRGHRPDLVCLRFRQSLFASQAKFIDIAFAVERRSGDFLRWLGIGQDPTPEQVVAHLLACSSQERPVGEDMWMYLNDHADDPAIEELRDQRCLLLPNGKYVTPSKVYWGWHPFGRWRYQLADSFSRYEALLDRLGVAEGPAPEHAVEVLLDIAGQHGGEQAALLDEDATVVRACWRLLTDALVAEITSAEVLADLDNGEVVLDTHGWLRKPTDVYFRDSLTLAERFDHEVNSRLIDRPDGMWQALAFAGVANLSDAVSTEILEQEMRELGGILPVRLRERHRLLLRVLSHDDPTAKQSLDRMREPGAIQRLTRLRIQQTLEIDGTPHSSAPFERGALFLKAEGQFRWVEGESTEPVWLEVARELTRAIGVNAASASSIASVLKGVLSAPSEHAARRELDELGYPALDEAIEGDVEPDVLSDLGGTTPPEAWHAEDPRTSGPPPEDSGPPPEDEDEDGAQPEDGSRATALFSPAVRVGQGSVSDHGDRAGSEQGAGGEVVSAASGERGEMSDRPTKSSSRSPSGRQSRLRSYVVPRAQADPTAGVPEEDDAEDHDVDRAAVEAALAYEQAHGRLPEEMPHSHPGYDIRSADPEGHVRYIEVKGTAVRWAEQGVGVSARQYAEAQRQREDYWIYVVDRALTEPHVHPIQDPVSQIDQYLFDDGWRAITEYADALRAPLVPLVLSDSPAGLQAAIPLRDLNADDTTTGWLRCSRPNRADDWFAVRIEGHGLGMGYRGGVALVRPLDRDPEEDDLLVVRLDDQTDPDTGTATTIRLWAPETDTDGRQLALRLWSKTGVAPLTVTHPDRLEVIGEVVDLLDVDSLEDLGVQAQPDLGDKKDLRT